MGFKSKKIHRRKSTYTKKKRGGFIKDDKKITADPVNYEITMQFVDKYMPLCSLDYDKNNYILVNNANYVLVNKKENSDYTLYKMDDLFDIKEISKADINIIPDSEIIKGINKRMYGINYFSAYTYNNDNIFRNFLSKVWTTGYPFFNRLKNIIYVKLKEGGVVYQNQINIVLSLIFMNDIDYVFKLYSELGSYLQEDTTNYHFIAKKEKPYDKKFGESKIEILFDYVYNYDSIMIDDPQFSIKKFKSFDDIKNSLNAVFSNIDKLHFSEQPQKDEFNIIMKIIRKVYDYVEKNPGIIDRYNYTIFIDKYKDLKIHRAEKTPLKSLIAFVNDYDRNTIKNKLILKLASLVYLCHKLDSEIIIKANIDTDEPSQSALYMLIDYLIGISKDKIRCVPINKLSVIRKLFDIAEQTEGELTDPVEIEFFDIVVNKFKVIEGYTFPSSNGGYHDCGETALLNTFNYFLFKDDGSFDLSQSESWDSKLKDFYMKYPTLEIMIRVPISELKGDWALVLNKRGNGIDYIKDQCELEPKVENFIKISSRLLNIKINPLSSRESQVFEIFSNLNNSKKLLEIDDFTMTTLGEEEEKVERFTIKYKKIFEIELSTAHGEFRSLKELDVFLQNNSFYAGISGTWISIGRIEPTKWSLEHFKAYLRGVGNRISSIWMLLANLVMENVNEEMCIEAINTINTEDDLLFKNYIVPYFFINIPKKTANICKAAISRNWICIKFMPIEFLKEDIISIAEINATERGESEAFIEFKNAGFKMSSEEIKKYVDEGAKKYFSTGWRGARLLMRGGR